MLQRKQRPLFQKDDCYAFRGLLMLFVIALHIQIKLYYHYGYSFLPFLNWDMYGAQCVGAFFLLSGYGLTLSLESWGITMGYISRSYKKLLLPFIVSFLVYVVLHAILYKPQLYFSHLATMTIPETSTWFVKIIIGIYTIVFLSFKFLKNRFPRLLCVTLITVIYIIFMQSIGAPRFWYDSIICFPLGMSMLYIKNHTPPICSYTYVLL